jgi:KUP system potassium uptake protein
MGAVFDLTKVTFFLGRELVLPTQKPGMALWRERLFSLITSVATRATAYFKIPTDQVVEIGYQVEI